MTIDATLNVPYNDPQYQATVGSLGSTVASLAQRGAEYVQAALDAIAIDTLSRAYLSVVQDLAQNIEKLVNGVYAALAADVVPPALYQLKESWLAVQQRLSLVGNGIKPEALGVDAHWQSQGAKDNVQAYKDVIKLQGDAVARCVSIAKTTSDRTARMAGYGFGFYLNINTLLVKLYLPIAAALASLRGPSAATVELAGRLLGELYNAVVEAVREYNVLENSAVIWVYPEMDNDLADQSGFSATGHWPGSQI